MSREAFGYAPARRAHRWAVRTVKPEAITALRRLCLGYSTVRTIDRIVRRELCSVGLMRGDAITDAGRRVGALNW